MPGPLVDKAMEAVANNLHRILYAPFPTEGRLDVEGFTRALYREFHARQNASWMTQLLNELINMGLIKQWKDLPDGIGFKLCNDRVLGFSWREERGSGVNIAHPGVYLKGPFQVMQWHEIRGYEFYLERLTWACWRSVETFGQPFYTRLNGEVFELPTLPDHPGRLPVCDHCQFQFSCLGGNVDRMRLDDLEGLAAERSKL